MSFNLSTEVQDRNPLLQGFRAIANRLTSISDGGTEEPTRPVTQRLERIDFRYLKVCGGSEVKRMGRRGEVR